eukprot:6214018-Pleurochrysis_carterae.AAC.4
MLALKLVAVYVYMAVGAHIIVWSQLLPCPLASSSMLRVSTAQGRLPPQRMTCSGPRRASPTPSFASIGESMAFSSAPSRCSLTQSVRPRPLPDCYAALTLTEAATPRLHLRVAKQQSCVPRRQHRREDPPPRHAHSSRVVRVATQAAMLMHMAYPPSRCDLVNTRPSNKILLRRWIAAARHAHR